MKTDIHPEYVECKVTCACGETFETRATKPEIRVEVCSKCHPFFTGTQKIVDTEGRVERFIKKYGLQEKYKDTGIGGEEEVEEAEQEAEQEAAEVEQ